jgi:hypothetical protein
MGEKSNELLAQDIQYIKDDIKLINEKLDKKYVSHETFDLSIKALNQAIGLVVKAGLFLATPVYGAIIALLFKIFQQ